MEGAASSSHGRQGGPRKLLREILEKNRQAMKDELVEKNVRTAMLNRNNRKRKRSLEDEEEEVLMELDFVDSEASGVGDEFSQRSNIIAETISEGDKKLKKFMSMDFDAFKAQLISDCVQRDKVRSYLKLVIKASTKLEKKNQQRCIERGKLVRTIRFLCKLKYLNFYLQKYY